MKATREAFGDTLPLMGDTNENILALDADLGGATKIRAFGDRHPDRFFQIGIAEANMIGIAAGLASEGQQVFTSTFSTFQTMRCFEQIRVNIGYMKHKVNMVGLASGLVLGMLGYTHCCIEDVSIMRSIPGIFSAKGRNKCVHWSSNLSISSGFRKSTVILYMSHDYTLPQKNRSVAANMDVDQLL
mgnify:CR=1 FL=1